MDRIIVGEVRGGEALDMMQAMNTGHDGSMTTIHANSPRDAFARLETMVLMAGLELPSRAIREQATSALNLIVHIRRYEDGIRRVQSITEVMGLEGETPANARDLSIRLCSGKQGKRLAGEYVATGIVPRVVEELRAGNIDVPMDLFRAAGIAR